MPALDSDADLTPGARGTRPYAAAAETVAPTARAVVSIRLLVPTIAVALLGCAVLGAAQISERNSRAILMRELETRLLLESRTLANTASGALLADFPELTLHPLVREMLAERPELALAAVVDHAGLIQGDPDARALGTKFHGPEGLETAPATISLKPGERLMQNRELLVAVAPIRAPSAGVLGTAWVAMRRAYLETAIIEARRKQSVLLLVLLVVGAASAFVLMTVLLRPISVLREGLERIGRGDLDTPLVLRDRTEIGVLADTVNRMAAQLKNAQHEAVERERLTREVELARGIQQSLLPHGRLDAGAFVLEGSQRAAAEVGGDYYDILPLGGGVIGIAIADVAGKGLGGCLVMSMLSALLRALRLAYRSPSQLLVALEENLLHTLPRGSFVTMFYGVLDTATGRLTFASAGHTPVLVWRAATRSIEWRKSRAVPIGAVRGGALRRSLQDEALELAPGDLLVHFTDGYNEAMRNGDGEQFGLERIAEVVSRNADQGPTLVIDALGNAVQEWAATELPMDDETLLVVAHTGTSATGRAPMRAAQVIPLPSRVTTPSASSAPTRMPEPVGAASTVAIPVAAPAPGPLPPRPSGSVAVPASDPRSALACLARARAGSAPLTIPADFAALAGLRAWIDQVSDFRGLEPRSSRLLESALYELCANIVEHGYAQDAARTMELWWVADTDCAHGDSASQRMRSGVFLLRDEGPSFAPRYRPLLDFNDPVVRRRGRGIGLDMIRRIVRAVEYHPGTEEGNLTIVRFDPESAGHHGGPA